MATSKIKSAVDQRSPVSFRVPIEEYARAEKICEAKSISISELGRVAFLNEINRLAGALPRKELSLIDLDRRLDLLAKQAESESIKRREEAQQIAVLVKMNDALCAALGVKESV
jgi:hypothetical protein